VEAIKSVHGVIEDIEEKGAGAADEQVQVVEVRKKGDILMSQVVEVRKKGDILMSQSSNTSSRSGRKRRIDSSAEKTSREISPEVVDMTQGENG
jgi:hypothetical protein